MSLSARLVPYSSVEVTAEGLFATTDRPWLELVFAGRAPSGCWVRISYRASYLDDLVRPLIAFETPSGDEWDVMRAALFGRACWIGRVPERTRRILINPVDRPGPFGFEIEGVEPVSRLSLLARGLRRNPRTAAMALGARLIHARRETRQALMFACGGVRMENYAQWREAHHRSFEPEGLDAPRRPTDRQPHLRFVLGREDCPLTRETPLVASLLASGADHWSLCLPHGADISGLAGGELAGRLVCAPADADLLIDDLCGADLVARLDPSFRVPDYAPGVLAEAALRHGEADCFYGDEDRQSPQGLPVSPQLKPDWSPQFEAHLAYLGAPVFWRVDRVRQMRAITTAGFDTAAWRREALEQATPAQVRHIRRILATGRVMPPLRRRPEPRRHAPPDKPVGVSIIIPTRNQLALLRDCLDGLRFKTTYPISEILIVDNGSDAPVHAFYAELAGDPRIRIMHRPGRFDFSAMCNAAAAHARGECLVFLNNDISIVTPGWLAPLVAEAMRPSIGAVGARLLFPDGSLQHAGVAVGMGGYADHVSHGRPGDYAGYLDRLGVPHEVGAVTGACIAVEARKFHAVQGFDAERYPVELSDIDLCLRLAAAGWTSLMRPDAVLVHHQSATRGFSFRPFRRYGLERGHFRAMWRDAIRDDPFFHPALSPFSTEPALDG